MRKAFGLARIVAAAALLLGAPFNAWSQEVNVEFDESVDFAKYKTFVLRDGKIESRAPALNSELTKKRLRTEIENALVKRGLTASTGEADLNVNFHFGSVRNLDSKSYPAGWRGMRTRVVNVPQSEGTLVVDLIDASTKSLVWRGTAIEGEKNPVKLAEKLDNMVKKAVGKYPPKK